MITKIISCADIHIPALKKIPELHPYLEQFIKQCKDIVKKEKDASKVRVVVAGDIFDDKITITNESMLEANWFFSELNNICKTYVFAGNHDFLMNNMSRVDSLTPLFEIGKYNNIVYVDRELEYKSGIIRDDNVSFCLYSSFESFKTPDIVADKELTNGINMMYVGLIHGDINGAVSPTARLTENGIDPIVFDGCDFVIAGHIHKRQEIKKNGVKIVYCSSLKQKDFGESVTGHGFVLWTIDEDDYSYKFVDLKYNDNAFYKFAIKSIDDLKDDREELLNY